MSIRTAIPSDARRLAAINVAAWRSAYRGLLPDSVLDKLSLEAKADRLRGRIIDPTTQVRVLEQDGAIVGYVTFGASQDGDADQERVGEIYALYLEPGNWRKGHGSALVQAAIVSLQDAKCAEVTLWALYNNERASRFYQALGFMADGATKVVTRADGTKMHEVRYRRSI